MTLKLSQNGTLTLHWLGSALQLDYRAAPGYGPIRHEAANLSGDSLSSFLTGLTRLIQAKPKPATSREAKPPKSEIRLIDGQEVAVVRMKI